MKTKKLNLLQTAKFVAIIAGFAGLVAGIIYSFGGLIIDALVTYGFITSSETPGLSEGTILAFGALIGMPLYFALWGFIVGLVGAFMYNLIGKRFKKPKWLFSVKPIKNYKLLSTAKYVAIISSFAGIVAGLIYSIGGSFYDYFTYGSLSYGSALAYIAIPIMPFYFAFWGFIVGLVGAWLYNWTGKKFNGKPKWLFGLK